MVRGERKSVPEKREVLTSAIIRVKEAEAPGWSGGSENLCRKNNRY